MITASPKEAKKFFQAKLDFTTGPVELNEMLKRKEDINIIDVRRPEDYQKGHIPGAVNLPKEKWNTFSGLSKNNTNVIYCYSEACHLAATAAKVFAENDFSVMELEGGFETWLNCKLPIET
jgi:rhodanese-related sulfurtransferase